MLPYDGVNSNLIPSLPQSSQSNRQQYYGKNIIEKDTLLCNKAVDRQTARETDRQRGQLYKISLFCV